MSVNKTKMQNNVLIRLFAILFGMVSIYQLSFTFITNQKESQAKTYATAKYASDVENYIELRDRASVNYLDSIGNKPIFGITSYNEAKAKELNKGLDLKGGMNVTLEVMVIDVLKALSNNSSDEFFNTSISNAVKAQEDSQEDFVTLFGTEYEKLSPNN